MYIEHFLWIAGGIILFIKLISTIINSIGEEPKDKMYNTINMLIWIIIVIIIEVVLYALIYPEEILLIKMLFG